MIVSAQGSAFALGPGVRLIVDLREVLEIEVGVDLGCRNVGMTQELLDGAQITGGLEEVRRERVTQKVRMNMGGGALRLRPARETLLNSARVDASAAAADE